MVTLITKKILNIILVCRNKLKDELKSFLGLDVRPSTRFLKDHFRGKSLVGVEIGVFKGDNAKSLLKNLNVRRLYLIDSYEKLYIKSEDIVPGMIEGSEYSVLIEKEPGFSGIVYNFEKCYQVAKENLKKFNSEIEFIRKKSEDAVNDIPENIDFLYIDGNHEYNYVKNDIEFYFPKIKSGGVISGHDFSAGCYGVAKAVLEFSEKNKLKLSGCDRDWWIVK